jgi:hypothetical protein
MANPPEGEQRCHGSCNVGSQPTDKALRAWEVVGRPQTSCNSSHHLPPSKIPEPARDLEDLSEYLASHIQALSITNGGFDSVVLVMDQTQRAAHRAIATPYELSRSSILNVSVMLTTTGAGAAIPIIDDINAVVAYLEVGHRDIHRLLILRDINGKELTTQVETRSEAEDSIGNEILATIVTLGGAILLKALAKVVVSEVAGTLSAAAIKAGVTAVKGISPEAGDLVLLFLRSLRARSIVRSFTQRGLKVVVNIGGEAGKEEIATFGEQIALNNQVRFGIGKKYVPNLVKEAGENIGNVFEENTVDKIVSRRLDRGIDTERVANGAFKVLKSGGQVNMQLFAPGSDIASRFVEALNKAGFKSVQNLGDTLFMAVKP